MPHHKQKLRFGNQLSPNDLEKNSTDKAIVNYYRCKIDDVKAKLHIILSSPYYDATSRWTDQCIQAAPYLTVSFSNRHQKFNQTKQIH